MTFPQNLHLIPGDEGISQTPREAHSALLVE